MSNSDFRHLKPIVHSNRFKKGQTIPGRPSLFCRHVASAKSAKLGLRSYQALSDVYTTITGHVFVRLDIPQLSLIQAEIMSQFVEDCLPDFVTNLGFIGADRLDVLLVEDDAVWPSG